VHACLPTRAFASGAEHARAISGVRDITREELIHPMKKIASVVERMLGTEPKGWRWA